MTFQIQGQLGLDLVVAALVDATMRIAQVRDLQSTHGHIVDNLIENRVAVKASYLVVTSLVVATTSLMLVAMIVQQLLTAVRSLLLLVYEERSTRVVSLGLADGGVSIRSVCRSQNRSVYSLLVEHPVEVESLGQVLHCAYQFDWLAELRGFGGNFNLWEAWLTRKKIIRNSIVLF